MWYEDWKKRELFRLILLILGIFLVFDQGTLSVVSMGAGITLITVFVGRLSIKICFPYLDMNALVEEIITENNEAAAKVVCSFIFLLCVIIVCTVWLVL